MKARIQNEVLVAVWQNNSNSAIALHITSQLKNLSDAAILLPNGLTLNLACK